MAETKALAVEYEATDSLVPYVNNANIHSEEQIEQIMASIKEFGFNDPVGVWTNANGEPEIVEGHGRVMAAKKLGLEKLPVIHLDSLTDEQRRAYTHVHNQQTRNSEFDWEMLDMEMGELDFDWGEFGFDLGVSVDDGLQEYDHAPATDNGYEYQEQYAVTVICKDEADQEKVYNKLVKEGYECKVVVV